MNSGLERRSHSNAVGREEELEEVDVDVDVHVDDDMNGKKPANDIMKQKESRSTRAGLGREIRIAACRGLVRVSGLRMTVVVLW